MGLKDESTGFVSSSPCLSIDVIRLSIDVSLLSTRWGGLVCLWEEGRVTSRRFVSSSLIGFVRGAYKSGALVFPLPTGGGGAHISQSKLWHTQDSSKYGTRKTVRSASIYDESTGFVCSPALCHDGRDATLEA